MVRACFAASEEGEFAYINGAMKSLCQDICLQTKFHQKVGCAERANLKIPFVLLKPSLRRKVDVRTLILIIFIFCIKYSSSELCDFSIKVKCLGV